MDVTSLERGTPTDPSAVRRAMGRGALVIVASGVLSTLLIIGLAYLFYAQNPPPCYGLGFGCSLDPAGAGFFYGLVLALPAVGGLLLALLAAGLLAPPQWRMGAVRLVEAIAVAAAVSAPVVFYLTSLEAGAI